MAIQSRTSSRTMLPNVFFTLSIKMTQSLIKKVRDRGLFWFFSRLLTEVDRPVSIIIKILRPFVLTFYTLCLLPINKIKFLFLKPTAISKDRLYLFYDLEVSPVTYDFAWALAAADYQRRKQGLSGVHVIFVPGKNSGLREEDPDYENKIDLFARRWRRYAILYSLAELLPTCSGVTFYSSRDEALLLCEQARPNIFPKKYSVTFPIPHSNFKLLTQQCSLMFLKPTEQARRYIRQWLISRAEGRKVIVITLRQSNYMPDRNSNIAAWAKFANNLNLREYCVVFVPDTEQAFEPPPPELKSFIYFTEPCWNLVLRAALYEIAYLNLGVNNGPMVLCWLNEACRYITFKMMVASAPQTSARSYRLQGFAIGKSLPFSHSWQVWVWKDDEEEIIRQEFTHMCAMIES